MRDLLGSGNAMQLPEVQHQTEAGARRPAGSAGHRGRPRGVSGGNPHGEQRHERAAAGKMTRAITCVCVYLPAGSPPSARRALRAAAVRRLEFLVFITRAGFCFVCCFVFLQHGLERRYLRAVWCLKCGSGVTSNDRALPEMTKVS